MHVCPNSSRRHASIANSISDQRFMILQHSAMKHENGLISSHRSVPDALESCDALERVPDALDFVPDALKSVPNAVESPPELILNGIYSDQGIPLQPPGRSIPQN